jgi:GNAT superfamily N-acetyltransferase
VQISPCEPGDLAALEALWPLRGCANRYARQVSGESSFLLVRDESEIVGRCEVRWAGPFMPEVQAALGAIPEINGLEVVTDHRGLGIGTAIIGDIEAQARRRGLTAIGLGVALDNHKAERLYRRLGYDGDLRYVDRYTWHDANGQPHDAADDCRFMTKQL